METKPQFDNTEWESKWLNRPLVPGMSDSQINHIPIPDQVTGSSLYRQLATALPEPMRPLFDAYTKGLLHLGRLLK